MSAPQTRDLPQDWLARREQLRLRSAQLRERIAQRAQVLHPALRLADRVRAGADWAHEHRAWLTLAGAAALGLVMGRPRRALALGLRLWSVWQVVRRAKPVLRTLWGRR